MAEDENLASFVYEYVMMERVMVRGNRYLSKVSVTKHQHQKRMKYGEKIEVAMKVDVGVKTPSLVVVCLLVQDQLMANNLK